MAAVHYSSVILRSGNKANEGLLSVRSATNELAMWSINAHWKSFGVKLSLLSEGWHRLVVCTLHHNASTCLCMLTHHVVMFQLVAKRGVTKISIDAGLPGALYGEVRYYVRLACLAGVRSHSWRVWLGNRSKSRAAAPFIASAMRPRLGGQREPSLVCDSSPTPCWRPKSSPWWQRTPNLWPRLESSCLLRLPRVQGLALVLVLVLVQVQVLVLVQPLIPVQVLVQVLVLALVPQGRWLWLVWWQQLIRPTLYSRSSLPRALCLRLVATPSRTCLGRR